MHYFMGLKFSVTDKIKNFWSHTIGKNKNTLLFFKYIYIRSTQFCEVAL